MEILHRKGQQSWQDVEAALPTEEEARRELEEEEIEDNAEIECFAGDTFTISSLCIIVSSLSFCS